MKTDKLCISYIMNPNNEKLIRNVAFEFGINHFEVLPLSSNLEGAVSMQSILPGNAVDIFSDYDDTYEWEEYLINLINNNPVNNFVFGCPRAKGTESEDIFKKIIKINNSQYFFEHIIEKIDAGKCLSIENTPKEYNTNIFTDYDEICAYLFAFYREHAYEDYVKDRLKINFDIGGYLKTHDFDVTKFNTSSINMINHVHVSTFGLQSLTTLTEEQKDKYKYIIECLENSNYNNYISLEVKLDNPSEKEIRNEIKIFCKLCNAL